MPNSILSGSASTLVLAFSLKKIGVMNVFSAAFFSPGLRLISVVKLVFFLFAPLISPETYISASSELFAFASTTLAVVAVILSGTTTPLKKLLLAGALGWGVIS